MGRDTRESSNELRSIAPLILLGSKPAKLVGACTLVTNGSKTIGFSSAELLRTAPDGLAVATKMDGSQAISVASWSMGRHSGLGIIELGPLAPGFTPNPKLDITPLPLGAIMASVDTRGAPSALVTIVKTESGVFSRRLIPVHVDAMDGGGMSDEITRLASPSDKPDDGAICDGASLFSWLPADPVLGRKSEVVVVALALTYHRKMYKPRDLGPIAELIGLEDLGRALPWGEKVAEDSNELGQVTGEIRDPLSGPLAGLDFDKD
jgi:hypothetical protein